MNRKRGVNNSENKLLYDPNQRKQRRLGAFSMEENVSDDEENSEEVEQEEETQGEEKSTEEQENQTLEDNGSDSSENSGTGNEEDKTRSTTGTLKNITMNTAKSLGGKFLKILGSAVSKILTFLLANPIVLAIIVGIIILLIVIILIFAAFEEENNRSTRTGLYGYEYFHVDNICDTVKVYNPDTGTYTRELDFETEYIPGVVYAEVGGFSDSPEVLKLFSVAARSYALTTLDESCTIEGSARVQAFTFDESAFETITADDHPIMQAVMDTYGLVAVKNGELMRTYYDAACYRGEDSNNYLIGYGSLTLGEEHQQSIPKSWAEGKGIMTYINGSKRNNTQCWGNHGYGISQYGAYYLATQQGYLMEDLLTYYNGDVSIYSIYEGVSTNYTLATSSGTSDILTMSLRDFLESQGTSVEAYNEYILSNIISAGVGTRDAAIVTAVSLVGSLYQYYGVRIPYTLCGQHYCVDMISNGTNVNRAATSFYGVDPNWGSTISNSSTGVYRYYYQGSWATYTRYGPDCSGFISWVLHNAGFNTTVLGADTQGNLGTKHALNGTQVGEPGDLLWHSGHIMIIVGVDTSSQVYYIAHAASGSQGVKINTVSFNSPGDYAVDMTEWYENNRLDITDEEFIERFRAGYVDGYTGQYDAVVMPVDSGIYFVGDSRTVGLCNTNSLCSSTSSCSTNTCLAQVSMGYSWFSNQINNIKNNSNGTVVINMGVNDIVGNANASTVANNYYSLYRELASSTPNKNFYIMSVNPVGTGTSVSQSNVSTFNSTMRSLINNSGLSNLKYLDSYNNVTFNTTDGLHYDSTTYRSLYQYVLREVG